jgi:hypothetical protein
LLWFVIILLAFITAAALIRRQARAIHATGPLRNWSIPKSWSVAEGTHEGKAVVTRFNLALRPVAGCGEFPDRIGIIAPLHNANDRGFPNRAEIKQLDAIEELIEQRMSSGNESLLAGVVTSNGLREFVIYTSNLESAKAKAEAVTREIATHELQVIVRNDPQWRVYRTFAS